MLSFFPRGVLDEILNLIESVSEGFPSYSSTGLVIQTNERRLLLVEPYTQSKTPTGRARQTEQDIY